MTKFRIQTHQWTGNDLTAGEASDITVGANIQFGCAPEGKYRGGKAVVTGVQAETFDATESSDSPEPGRLWRFSKRDSSILIMID